MVRFRRFDVCLVQLDPTVGSEINKTRPAVIVSPDSMNDSRLKTVIIAPMTSTVRGNFPTRVTLQFMKKTGQIALDQIRAIDRVRIVKVLGHINEESENAIIHILAILFGR